MLNKKCGQNFKNLTLKTHSFLNAELMLPFQAALCRTLQQTSSACALPCVSDLAFKLARVAWTNLVCHRTSSRYPAMPSVQQLKNTRAAQSPPQKCFTRMKGKCALWRPLTIPFKCKDHKTFLYSLVHNGKLLPNDSQRHAAYALQLLQESLLGACPDLRICVWCSRL